MKKFFVVLALSVFAIACAHKTIPAGSTTNTTATTTNTNTGSTTTPADSSSTATVADASVLQAGHTIYTTRCVKCHAVKNTANFTRVQWDGILKEMAPKAKLNETEKAQVTAYVKANAKDAQP
jgi:hypothetical protein